MLNSSLTAELQILARETTGTPCRQPGYRQLHYCWRWLYNRQTCPHQKVTCIYRSIRAVFDDCTFQNCCTRTKLWSISISAGVTHINFKLPPNMWLLFIVIITPPPIHRGWVNVFDSSDFFVCLFVYLFVSLFFCQQDYDKTAGPICMKFSGKVWSDHGTTLLHFWSIPRNCAVPRC